MLARSEPIVNRYILIGLNETCWVDEEQKSQMIPGEKDNNGFCKNNQFNYFFPAWFFCQEKFGNRFQGRIRNVAWLTLSLLLLLLLLTPIRKCCSGSFLCSLRLNFVKRSSCQEKNSWLAHPIKETCAKASGLSSGGIRSSRVNI